MRTCRGADGTTSILRPLRYHDVNGKATEQIVGDGNTRRLEALRSAKVLHRLAQKLRYGVTYGVDIRIAQSKIAEQVPQQDNLANQ